MRGRERLSEKNRRREGQRGTERQRKKDKEHRDIVLIKIKTVEDKRREKVQKKVKNHIRTFTHKK